MYGALSNPLVLPDDFEKAIGEAFKYFQENINNSQKRPTLFDKSIFIEANEIIDDKPQGFWHIISLETKHQFKVLPCVNDCTIDICNQNCINGQRKVKIKHGTEERNICLLRASRLPWVVDIINLANKDNSQIKMWLKENKNYNNQKLYIRYTCGGADYVVILSVEKHFYRLISAYPVFYIKDKKDFEKDYTEYKWSYFKK